jgi:hypothetical protein
MDFHGITMKGKYYAEQVTSPTGADTAGRVVINTSNVANGVDVSFNGNKLFFNNGTYWLRPLVANKDDGPDQDIQWDLGTASYRWRRIYAANFYGSVRYS